MANENLIGAELEALEDEEAIAEEKEAAKAKANDEEDGDDDADEGDDEAPAAEAAEPAAKGEKADEPGDDEAGDKPADEPALKLDQPFIPPIPGAEDFDYDAEREVLLDRRKDLRAQLRNGDIDQDTFDEKLDEVNDDINKLDVRKARVDSAREQSAALAAAHWQWTLTQVKDHIKSTEGIDYDAKENSGLLASWDQKIKALAGDEANADKPGEWFAMEAHKQVRAEIEALAAKLGLKREGGEKPKAPASDPKVKEALNKRKPDTKAAKSLASLPSAEAAATGDQDAFAHLDGLDGLALEMALAKLPKDQADAYLAGK